MLESIKTFIESTGIARLLASEDAWKTLIMLAISAVLIYLAIVKKFEPLLLLPIAIGMLLTNLPGGGMFHLDMFIPNNSIIEALDAKDSFTLGRSRRVAFYALKIVNKMSLTPSEISKIELAGLLHDIGMIGVAEEILNKTQKLSDEEYEKIKLHVHYSVKILEDIKQLAEITEIIKYHHEYYNGCGYPYGLKGDEIPLGSRIIAIADAYDSMISNRAYRKSLTSEEAVKIIEQGAGKQFDPDLVEIFKAILPQAMEEIEQYESKSFYME
jgi:HD-GYP domain-containing protein (c-di-GMP phosphodiesterase class II)